jgi:hypothetical protein
MVKKEKYTVCLNCKKKVKVIRVTSRKTGIRGIGRPMIHYEFSCGHGSTALVNDVDGFLEHFKNKNQK